MARAQLIELGVSAKAIRHRVARGRLHPVRRGVYAVGRPDLTRHGHWMAAVLSCGPAAVISHESAAALWRICDRYRGPIEVSVPSTSAPRPTDIRVHRRTSLGAAHLAVHDNIPLTSPVRTLLDLATRLTQPELEAAINAADKRELTDPESLRAALERRFVPIARRAGLPAALAQVRLNGFRVDFFWPDLGLVVETDGLHYHRTPAQQARDHRRDQAHTAAGLTPLRFTHAQVRYEPRYVEGILATTTRRLTSAA